MKKILVIILLFVMCFSMISCNNTSDSEELYTVKFVTNNGSPIFDKKTSVLEVMPISIRENYSLAGWYFDEKLTIKAEFPLSVDTNITLYAKWVETRESIQTRFFEYCNSQTNSQINYSENIHPSTSTIGTYEGKIRITSQETIYLSASYKYYDADNIYETITINLYFDFGDITEATGSISYKQSNNVSATFDIESTIKSGNSYIPNGHLWSFSESGNYTDSELSILIKEQFKLTMESFINHLPNEYKASMLDYEGSLN